MFNENEINSEPEPDSEPEDLEPQWDEEIIGEEAPEPDTKDTESESDSNG